MFKKILENYKNFEKITYKILKNGLKFCLALCMISISILFTYDLFILSPSIYYVGITLFKLSLIFGTEFIICGFVIDGIKKQLI
jgi:hypothetical protein